MSNKLIDAVIEIATAEIGVRESDNNSGKRVREFQAATTLGGTHWPWCSAYCCWVLRQAAAKLKLKTLDYCYSASCDVVAAWAKSEGVLHESPKAGDFFLSYSSPHDASHTGLVTAVSGAKFTSVEGNTAIDGRREGIGVFKRQRINGNRYKFVRWIDANQQATAAAKPEMWMAKIGALTLPNLPRINGSVYVPVRLWAQSLGIRLDFNAETQTVLFDGREVPSQLRIVEGVGLLPIRSLASFSALQLDVSGSDKSITVYR